MFFNRNRRKVLFHHADANHGTVEVVEEEHVRHLLFGNKVKQGGMDLRSPDTILLKYQRQMVKVFEGREIDSCLCLGLGAGSIPKHILNLQSCSQVEVVEINPVVVDVAKQYFDLPEGVVVHTVDAMDFVSQSSKQYDLLMVDLFNKSGTPVQFRTPSFYQQLSKRLNRGGIVVLNAWVNEFSRHLHEETLARVFGAVEVVSSETASNHIAFCGVRSS